MLVYQAALPSTDQYGAYSHQYEPTKSGRDSSRWRDSRKTARVHGTLANCGIHLGERAEHNLVVKARKTSLPGRP